MSYDAYQKSETRVPGTGLETVSWDFRLGTPNVGCRTHDPKIIK